MSIDLRMFCAAEDLRYAFSSPWVRGGWEYATDGRIMVRVPNEGTDTPEEEGHRFPPACEIFDKNLDASLCTLPWPDVRYCLHCFGKGEVGCQGEKIEYDNFRGEWEGCKSKCPLCNGVPAPDGVIIAKSLPSIQVGEHWVQVLYHAKVSTLPGVKFAPAKDTKPLPFIFDGGQGCVMGVRKEQ